MHHRHHLHRGRSRVQTFPVPFSTNVDNIYTLQERYKEMVEDEMSLVTSPSSLYADRCSSATLNATKNTAPFRGIRLCSSFDSHDDDDDDVSIDMNKLDQSFKSIVTLSSSWRMTDDEYVDTTAATTATTTKPTTDKNSSQPGEKGQQQQQRPPERQRSPHRGHRRSRNMAMTGQEFWDQVLKEV